MTCQSHHAGSTFLTDSIEISKGHLSLLQRSNNKSLKMKYFYDRDKIYSYVKNHEYTFHFMSVNQGEKNKLKQTERTKCMIKVRGDKHPYFLELQS